MKKKKILLFGASGMAGHVVYSFLNELKLYEITPIVYRKKVSESAIIIDVSNTEAVINLVRTQKPDFIVNCIGVLVKGSQKYPDNAILLNAYFPHLLKRLADEVHARLIHISTDCVFSGKKGNYCEDDPQDAEDLYGKSKGLGEIVSESHLTLRTSIIGPEIKSEGEGLFHWFMLKEGKVQGFTEAFWSGITTLQLASAIQSAIENDLTGLLHVTNGEKICKYDLITQFKKVWERNLVIVESVPGKAVDKSLLKSTKFDFNVPSYSVMLNDLKEWMTSHAFLYDQLYC
ncbi:MAG TPA: SDR family oxidoreductase [Flavipsychrobacter sp.]|nr:SDR family oxidoreductase [Flavipsychrobacter sp.]